VGKVCVMRVIAASTSSIVVAKPKRIRSPRLIGMNISRCECSFDRRRMRRAETEKIAMSRTIAERRDEVTLYQSFQAQRGETLQKLRHQGGSVRVDLRDGDAACGRQIRRSCIRRVGDGLARRSGEGTRNHPVSRVDLTGRIRRLRTCRICQDKRSDNK
jgi:hypothetical protein